jgi:hypothetical protein
MRIVTFTVLLPVARRNLTSQLIEPWLRTYGPFRRRVLQPSVWQARVQDRNGAAADRRDIAQTHRSQVIRQRLGTLPFKKRVPRRPAEMPREIDRQIMAGRNQLHFFEHQMAVSRDRVGVDAAADERPRNPGRQAVATESNPQIPIADTA